MEVVGNVVGGKGIKESIKNCGMSGIKRTVGDNVGQSSTTLVAEKKVTSASSDSDSKKDEEENREEAKRCL